MLLAALSLQVAPGLALAEDEPLELGQQLELFVDEHLIESLDGAGEGQAAFSLPPASAPALAGLTAHHAYLVIDTLSSGSPTIAFTSNAQPVSFRIEPRSAVPSRGLLSHPSTGVRLWALADAVARPMLWAPRGPQVSECVRGSCPGAS